MNMTDAERQSEVSRDTQRARKRCVIVGTRSMSKRARHFLSDLHCLIPCSTLSKKLSTDKSLTEAMKWTTEAQGGGSSMMLHTTDGGTLMWVTGGSSGPSASFVLKSLTTASELNTVRDDIGHSNNVLHFDKEFTEVPHLRVIKALLTGIFGPQKRSAFKRSVDHVCSFFYYDGNVWLRNYTVNVEGDDVELVEFGPRCALCPLAIIDGSFEGSCVWYNDQYRTDKDAH
ncbi:ribosome biogenesis protein [Perkinsela sp. CCAP 1560/4]|nr:ribosome biogenesis protein [Perkinsela sp. CCAP 1560/4]|eukprot:KNH06058.1 ribosome biogenesis protein [Perkinsela sp. CCAP 1560/4]